MSKRKITIWMGDLHHRTIGRHSTFMPVSLGYIASYTQAKVGAENIDFKFFGNADELLEALDREQPDVLALSNYVWNSELSMRVFRYARDLDVNIINIAGGPDIPQEESEWKAFLENRREVDFYVVREGELPFALLIEKIVAGDSTEKLLSEIQPGVMALDPVTGEFNWGPKIDRLMNLDEIPSPYLNGMMDQWFDGTYHPFIQAGRGCPYACTFCSTGEDWYNKVYRFSAERLRDEITFMAERMVDYPSMDLALCDANFGQYKEDEEIALIINKIQKDFGWPNVIRSTTGKSQHERVLRVVETLNNKMEVSLAAQSFNEATLAAVKRKNLPLDRYLELQAETARRGIRTYVDLIVPLPEETKESFFNGVEILTNAGIEHVVPFTTVLLKDSALANHETRERYGLQAKYRLLSRQFGEYAGEKVFEIEEVCIATNTMSFQEYLDSTRCR